MPAIRLTMTAEKGGVGKSMLSANLAGYLAKCHGFRVLMIDTDSQASNSKFFLGLEAVRTMAADQTIAAVFDPAVPSDPERMIHRTKFEGIDFIPSTRHLKPFDLAQPHLTGELQYAMREFLDEVGRDYHFVICDTSPSLEILPTWGCLLSSHFTITPLQMEDDSIQSIEGTDAVIRAAAERNLSLSFLGYVVNMIDRRRKWHERNERLLRQVHGDRVFKTALPNLTAFGEARGFKQPITEYASSGDALELTKELCQEMLTRMTRQVAARQNTNQAAKKEAA